VTTDHEICDPFPWRPCLLVFLVALAVRVFFLTLIPEDALRPSTDWEMNAIAISLLTEGQFANPYVVPTGPTAHLAPIPPMLTALVFKVFGITALGGIVAWLIRLLFQSVIWGLLPWVGARTGLGWKAGLAGGLAGALWPQFLAHGEALAAVLMGLLAVAMVRRWSSTPTPASSLLLGAAFGVSFHVQPVFLLVLVGYLVYELWRRSDRARWGSAALVLAGAFLVCVPWGIRNYRAFDAVFFVRSNFGLELRMGNHEGATANIDDPHFDGYSGHPRTHREEAIRLRELGEVEYMRESGREALEWIRSNPGEFVRLTARRIRYFWLGPLDDAVMALAFVTLVGLAALGIVGMLRRRGPGFRSGALPHAQVAALLIPLLTYPLVYYLVPWQHRYRFPIEWILFLLAGAALWPMPRRDRSGEEAAGG
jgi:hypothetical protein